MSERLRRRTRRVVETLDHGLTPRRLLPIALILGVLLGWGVGQIASAAATSRDQIVVGNTAGTLSVLLALDGTRIVIGGGDARAELADLVERSSLPWARSIHLLLVPASDTRHAIGALGLVERGHVRHIVLLGEPDRDPLWSMLENEAERTGARFERITSAHRTELPGGTVVTIAVPVDEADRPLGISEVNIERDALRLAIVDQVPAATTPARQTLDAPPPHLRIALRPQAAPSPAGTVVLVRPAPRQGRDATPSGARYSAEIARGERLALRFSSDGLRMPLDRLTAEDPGPS